jgi:uncharacterized membrane protein
LQRSIIVVRQLILVKNNAMKHQFPRQLLLIGLVCLFLISPAGVRAQEAPPVRAILFYSPTCPHCHQVINEVLLPMVEEHGERLQIVAIDVTQAGGQQLYQSAIEHFQIPEERLGVPALVVGDVVLVGSGEIPDQFPVIVNEAKATGLDWPAIPGFVPPADPGPEATLTPAPGITATPAATATATTGAAATIESETDQTANAAPPDENQPLATASGSQQAPFVLDSDQSVTTEEMAEEPPADPLGFALAAVVLVAMVVACVYAAWRFIVAIPVWRKAGHMPDVPEVSWAIPLLAALGIGVAAYLAYVEITQVKAVCGPVGHCNLVQSSPYAQILGIPIALLGIGTYLAIIGLWIVHRLSGGGQEQRQGWRRWVLPGLAGLTIFGVLFSIYLTLLELLVIYAVCAWCLTSAVIMTILMLLAVTPLTTKREPATD